MLSRRARVGSSAMSMMPVVLDRPPPICPHLNPRCFCKRSRHWSASALRSTRMRAEVAREAMAAQAITVLPKPGGAISTLVSSTGRGGEALEALPSRVGVRGPAIVEGKYIVAGLVVAAEELALAVLNLAPSTQGRDGGRID